MKKIFLDHWKTYCWLLPLTFVLTYGLMLGVPNEYRSEAKMVHERQGVEVYGGYNAQQTLGMPVGVLEMKDALMYDVMPDIIQSNEFMVNLLPEKVCTQDGKFEGSLYAYLVAYQKKFFRSPDVPDAEKLAQYADNAAAMNKNGLNVEQAYVLSMARSHISASYHQHTCVITVSVTMQDPAVAAQVADLVVAHLNQFMDAYHKRKAAAGMRFYDEMITDARSEYAKVLLVEDSLLAQQKSTSDYKVQLRVVRDEVEQKYKACESLEAQRAIVRSHLNDSPMAFAMIQQGFAATSSSAPRRMPTAVLVTLLVAMLAFVWWARDWFLKFL